MSGNTCQCKQLFIFMDIGENGSPKVTNSLGREK